jgi:hypothetical protein
MGLGNIRRAKATVPMAECKLRALRYLGKQHCRELIKASSVAGAIWPGVEFHPQGAGAAASRILRKLIDDKTAEWTRAWNNDWGYRITPLGRTFLTEN